MIRLLPALLPLAFPSAPSAPVPQGRGVAIRADRVLLGDGQVLAPGVILVEDGRIAAVGTDVSIPDGTIVSVHKGTASAGLVALHSYSGSPGEMRDSTRTLMPEARVVVAFDPTHPDFEAAIEAGITSVVLAPLPLAVCAGTSALVKSSGGVVVQKDAQLALGFSAQTLRNDRAPTSVGGALAELDRRLEKPEGAFALAAQKKLPVLFEVSTRDDVARAVEFASRHELTGAIHGAPWAGELAAPIHAAGLAVICGPFQVGEARRDLLAVVALAKAGVPFGFGLDSPWNDAVSLRTSAAMCVREGLDRAVAWRALTSDAARIVGAGDRVGGLEKGMDADIVLWSGDPLDLASSVDAVYVDGKRAWGRKL
ncbi:MAG TPA: amidohydrolase family protein [Planctomycetota bacterium]|jgi:imidazolonepropionase-like amidohydrolase|nr:amidohydrolase family protein [Planctomycetota bacterium]